MWRIFLALARRSLKRGWPRREALPEIKIAPEGPKEFAMKTKFSLLTVAAFALILLSAGVSTANAQRIGFNIGTNGFSFGLGIGHQRHRRSHCHTAGCRTTIAGHYDLVPDRVWRPGHSRQIWVPARYSYRNRCGRRVRVLVRRGYYRTVHTPGYWDTINRRVWVAASTRYTCGY